MAPSSEVNAAVGAAPQPLEQEIVDAARERLVGVKRAFGSLAAQLQTEWARETQRDFEKCVAICRKLAVLRGEADALADRFGLPAPELVVPGVLDGALGTAWARPRRQVERCEHDLRERRTYYEVAGSEAYAIILRAGRKPWRALTDREQEYVARLAAKQAREREAQQRFAERTSTEAAAVARVPFGS